jgi:hypothetical protein
MGLDTHIYNTEKNEIGYFRKYYQFRDYWIDFARKKYPELANKPPKSWKGQDKKYWQKVYADGYYNCVDIPVNRDQWRECFNHFLGRYVGMLNSNDFVCHQFIELQQFNRDIVDGDYFAKNEYLYINNWW